MAKPIGLELLEQALREIHSDLREMIENAENDRREIRRQFDNLSVTLSGQLTGFEQRMSGMLRQAGNTDKTAARQYRPESQVMQGRFRLDCA